MGKYTAELTLHAMMGAMLEIGVHQDVVMLFAPSGEIREAGAWVAMEHATRKREELGVLPLLRKNAWQPHDVLATCVMWVLWKAPGCDARSNLIGSYYLMACMPWWSRENGEEMQKRMKNVVALASGQPRAFPDEGRAILRAYDHGLGLAAAARERFDTAANEEGQTYED